VASVALEACAVVFKPLVLGKLVAYPFFKRLKTWMFPGKQRGRAPQGTVANAQCAVAVEEDLSL